MLAVCVVASVVAAVHAPALRARAISFDDHQYLLENDLVRNPGWNSARRFLTEVLEPSTVQGYYQPLSMISLMLDTATGGSVKDFRPYHRASLLLHVANAILVLLIVQRLFGQVWLSLAIACLFGLHPLTVEPIPWIGERKTLLAAFFAFGALLSYFRYVCNRASMWYVCSLVLFLIALMSKPTTTPLPALLLVLDWWPLRRFSIRTCLEKIPFVVLSVAFAIITYVSQARTAFADVPSSGGIARIPLILAHDLVFYICKFLLPIRLSSHYPIPEPLSAANPRVLIEMIAAAAVIVLVLLSLKRTRVLAAGLAFFFLAMLPTSGVIGFSNVITADKYVYLPMLGFLLVIAGALNHWVPRVPAGSGANDGRVPRWGLVLLVGLLLLEIIGTRNQLRYWQTTEQLYARMLELSPDDWTLQQGIAVGYAQEERYAEAIPHYRAALQLNPDVDSVHYNLGNALIHLGQKEEALAAYQRATQLNPLNAEAWSNRGYALAMLGRADAAIPMYEQAIKLRPKYVPAHNNLAVALAQGGRLPEAIDHLKTGLILSPGNANAHANLANMLTVQSRPAEAEQEYAEAVRLKPGFAAPLIGWGNLLVSQNRITEAREKFQRVLQSDPKNAAAGEQLAALATRPADH